jgi:monofunctional biosynthetic peptidoglycan transglycosylase
MQHKIYYFLIILVAALATTAQTKAEDKLNSSHINETVLFDFKNADQLEPWIIVNDGVMGGLSQGKITASNEQSAIFAGTVSLDNNGGFTSTRTLPQKYNLKDYAGIKLRVKGDGKNYQFRVRTNGRFDGVSYRYKFATKKNTWTVIEIPFDKFEPVFRGRILNDVEPITPSKIEQLGFLIANKRYEEFKLEIDWIKAYQ